MSLFWDNHDNPRMISKVDPEGLYRFKLAKMLMLVQLTLKGTPFLYQGQEIGMCNQNFTSLFKCAVRNQRSRPGSHAMGGGGFRRIHKRGQRLDGRGRRLLELQRGGTVGE